MYSFINTNKACDGNTAGQMSTFALELLGKEHPTGV
jgi:hypothetical protein